jgi:ABC-type nickel/cobalt efflux system permease component RcnA
MSIATELFLAGFAVGISRCIFLCSPVLVPFLAGTKDRWREGLLNMIVFSISRLSAYVTLGLMAGSFGMLITNFFYESAFGLYLWTLGGSFIILLGLFILWGKEPKMGLCQFLHRYTIGKSVISMALLGFIFSLRPCPSLLGVLSYIALNVGNPSIGAFYGLCFGVGSTILSPLLVIGVFASAAPRAIFKTPGIYRFFRRFCGVLLVLFGLRMIIKI